MCMTDEFAQEFGNDKYQELFEAYYLALNQGNGSKIVVWNYTFTSYSAFSSMGQGYATGYFEHNGREVSFELRDGNNNGSEIISYEVLDIKSAMQPMAKVVEKKLSIKACTCEWNHVKAYGCKCGAITPYKPTYY